jgi:RsiW-degrading membrane proteinase PrsW (M82 family)
MQYVLLAAAPGIAICLYIFYRDVYNREPGLNLIISFVLGCAALWPAMKIEEAFLLKTVDGSLGGLAIFCYAIVALSEEGGKFLGLRIYSYNQKCFDEPLDGIVYSVMIRMGFATAENIRYLTVYAEHGTEYQLGLFRMFTAIPAHASFAIVMGYFVGKAKFEPDNKKKVLLSFAGLLGAVVLHGTYDFFLLMPRYTYVGMEQGIQFLAYGGFVSLVLSIILCIKLLKRDRNISRQMFKPKAPPSSPTNNV